MRHVFMLVGILALAGCKVPEVAVEALATRDETPFPFFTQSHCWANAVKTNGPRFGEAGNSGYLCHTTDLSTLENSREIWLGFYRDGTISLRRKDGVDYVYTTIEDFRPGANQDASDLCMLHLMDVNAPADRYFEISRGAYNGDFDGDGYIDSLWQSYFNSPADVYSAENTSMLCEFRESFGV